MRRCLTAASLASLAFGLLTIAACGNSTGLPTGQQNVIDTVSLYALDGTALDLPSAFRVVKPHAVRTDLESDFDFAFNITPAGQAVLLPTGALHLGIGSGIDTVTASFDAITVAPGGPYIDSLPVPVHSGTVAVVHSTPISSSAASVCLTGIGYFYAKLQVLAIDSIARRIDLQVLANQNCGYRSLAPGFPTK